MVEPDGSYLGECRKDNLCSSCQATRTAILNEKKEMLEFLEDLKKEHNKLGWKPEFPIGSLNITKKINTLIEEIKILGGKE